MTYQRIKNSNVLVTGGAGFIGSNLCEDLLKYDNKVVCLDNFSTGRIENLNEFLYHPNFKLIVGDIRNLDDCKKAMDGIDIVLQEAALGSVPRSINDPITTNSVNVGGFLNVLIAARDAKVKRLVYAASSSTYGDSENLPKVDFDRDKIIEVLTNLVHNAIKEEVKFVSNLVSIALVVER